MVTLLVIKKTTQPICGFRDHLQVGFCQFSKWLLFICLCDKSFVVVCLGRPWSKGAADPQRVGIDSYCF